MNRLVPACATLLAALALLVVGSRSALACSVGPYEPPFAFRVPPLGEADELSVANDGFFRIEVDGGFANDADEAASIAVEVTDATGAAIAGSVHAFPSRPGLFWQSHAVLPDGAYRAAVSAPAHPDVSRFDFTLVVHGAPTSLALGTVELLGWLEIHQLSGGRRLTCKPFVTCSTLEFGEQEQLLPGADLRIVPPPINGQVYWNASVERTDGSDPLTYMSAGGVFSRSGDEGGGHLSFPTDATEYCGILKVVDLRDDHALSSAPICWQPSAPQVVDNTDLIANCPEPPSPEMRSIWCRFHAGQPECQGVDVGVPAGSAGTGGGAGTTTSQSPPTDDSASDDASSACNIGHSRRASGLGAAALLAFAAFGLRRHRRVGILLACALIGPFTFATGLQSSALKLALACSGAGAEETIVESYSVVKSEGTNEIPIADDGFFLLRVAGRFAYPDRPETSISLRMSDSTDTTVEGTLRAIGGDVVAWTANTPLVAGIYHATISAPSNPRLALATATLRSGGPRETLRPAQLAAGDWFTRHTLAEGPSVTCTGAFGDCGGGTMSFREREASFRSVEVSLRVPDLASTVYWEMSILPVPGKGTFQERFLDALDPVELFFPGQAWSSKLTFADDLDEYCVVVHAVDRRDGSSVDSAPQCWTPKTPVRVDEDDATLAQLRQCDAPPSPALAARWCALQADPSRIPQCQDVPDQNSAGSAGTGSAESAGSAGQLETSPAGGGAHPDLGDDTGGEKSSSTCSVGHSRSASGLGAAALLALAALGLRRRVIRP